MSDPTPGAIAAAKAILHSDPKYILPEGKTYQAAQIIDKETRCSDLTTALRELVEELSKQGESVSFPPTSFEIAFNAARTLLGEIEG